MKYLIVFFSLLLLLTNCNKQTETITPPTVLLPAPTSPTPTVTNPYQHLMGRYIGPYDPFNNAPTYTAVIYIDTINIDSFAILGLDQEPITLEIIDSSYLYYLDCPYTHCGRYIEFIAPDTLKYSYAYSWLGASGGYDRETFVGVKQ